jgi:hypothetical protein
MTLEKDFEELAMDLETTRKIISSDKYISELDKLSPYKNEHELKCQVEYWSKLLLEKLYKAKDSLEELLHDDPYTNAIIGLSKELKDEEPLSVFEAYTLQLTVIANSNATWGRRAFDRECIKLQFPEDYPDKAIIYNQCHNNIRLIYSDPNFWKLHHLELDDNALEQRVADYLLNHYGMMFDFPYSVWQQMVIKPIHRNFLCLLMTIFPVQYFQTNKNADDREQLLDVVGEHLDSPRLDLSGYLASEQLTKIQLKKLRDMASHIKRSVKWCLDNDNKPIIQSQSALPIRPRDWEKSMKLEQMVNLIYKGKGLAEHPSNLAHEFFGQAEPPDRRLANQAQALFKFREYFSLKNYLKGHST